MKRTKSNIVIETGGEGTEESFGIGNLGFILKVLRGKMYSNPIKAICREISSNSRDAHREIGKDDLPIEIHLPNTFDSHIKFKDYGPGIDPQRMSGVFILYGNTTKDSDNVQTGGFGLGAKTPFAYSDQFSIFTITPENRGDKIVNIKRNYIAYIDPSEAGKMRKISEEETDEPCGTELSIYVDGNDWGSFTDAVMEVTAYWDVKPKLSGRSPLPEYKEDSAEPFLQGNGWSMPQFEDQGYYDEDQSLAIVDGIAYPIDRNNMKSLEASEIDLLRHGLRFHFGVGELSLSSNRERLQYDDNTVGLIKEKLIEVMSEVGKLLRDKLEAQTSLREAAQFFHDFKQTLACAIPKDFEPIWEGHPCESMIFTITIDRRNASSYYYKDEKDIKKGIFLDSYCLGTSRRSYDKVLKREETTTVKLNKDTVLYVNDLSTERVSRTRIHQIFKDSEENNTGIETVQILTFSDGDVAGGLDNCKDASKAKTDLRLLGINMLSSVTLPEKEKRAKKKRNGRGKNRGCIAAFLLDSTYEGYRSCDSRWRPSEIEKKSTDAGVYVIVENHKKTIYSGNLQLDTVQALEIKEFLGADVEIHGIHSRDLENLGPNWEQLENVLKREYDAKLGEPSLTEMCNAIGGAQYLMSGTVSGRMFDFITNNISKVEDNNGALKRYFDMSEKSKNDANKYQQLWKITRFVYPKEYDKKFDEKKSKLCALKKEFEERYSLLNKLDSWDMPTAEAFFEYINLIDNKYNSADDKTVDNSSASVTMAAIA